MPSLWKHPNSPYWTCCYTDADGKRRKKSTKQSLRTKAMQVCIAFEHAEADAKDHVATEAQMRRVLSETLARVTGKRLNCPTVRAWFDQWIADRRLSLSVATLSKYEQVRREFFEFLGVRADARLESVTIEDIVSFRDGLQADGRSPSTVNQLIQKTLSVPFVKAFRIGIIPVNPVAGLTAVRSKSSTRDVFTPEQMRTLLATAEGDWRGAILAGYFTGARLQDICNLRWSNIDFERRVVSFSQRKTEKKIAVPLHPELEASLKTVKSTGGPEDYVFSTLGGRRESGRSGLSKQFMAIMDRAKISGDVKKPIKTGQKSKARSFSSLSFHSLRHSFNSALANAGVSQELRQKLTGHASAEMNDRYTHHQLETLREAVSLVPGIFGDPARPE